jgi:DNA-dependent RNA polymerase auxiliary subunit epsilon
MTQEGLADPIDPSLINLKVIEQTIPKVENSKSSRLSYRSSIRRLVKLLKTDRIFEEFSNYKNIIKVITENNWPTNTKKATLQVVLRVIHWFQLKLPKNALDEYKQEFIYLNAKSREETQNRNMTEEVLEYDTEYMKLINDNFLKYDKMTAFTKIFQELPIRDNFANMKIISQKEETGDRSQNYILVNKTGQITVFINDSKTQGKFDYILKNGIILSLNLSNYLREYIKAKKLKDGGLLFGKSLMSGFVSLNNSKIGIEGGFDMLRRMKIKWVENNQTLREKTNWAQIMGHDFNTQQNTYLSSAPTVPLEIKRRAKRKNSKGGPSSTVLNSI